MTTFLVLRVYRHPHRDITVITNDALKQINKVQIFLLVAEWKNSG